jgi:hypothetical protein
MAPTKGPALEEVVRAYFSRQGFFSLRSVPYRFDDEDVTDLDVWLYSRHAASVRTRIIVDVKNKKSPRAFERVLWVKGAQSVLKCDRAVIATTDANPALSRFAQTQGITVLSKSFLDRLEKKLAADKRMTLEQFIELIQANSAHKQDGDWIKVLGDTKSAVASTAGFPAFNKAMLAFRFFAERAEVRMQHRQVALRCALLTAAIACIALDSALERFVFSEVDQRLEGLKEGVLFGDSGDGRMRLSIDAALSALSDGMPNGRVLAAQAKQNFQRQLEALRGDIIAEYFVREHNAQHLFSVARELDEAAHFAGDGNQPSLSIEARSTLGIFADFVNVKRSVLPMGSHSDLKASMTDSASDSLSVSEDAETSATAPMATSSTDSGDGQNAAQGKDDSAPDLKSEAPGQRNLL